MLLLVGRLRSQRLCCPSLSITLRMYLASGEMATKAALPVSVTFVIEMF